MSIYQVVSKQRWLLQEIRNVFYYETRVGDPSTSEWQDICDEFRATYSGILKNDLSDEWAFYGINVKQVDVAGLNSFDYVPTAGDLVGDITVDDVPTQVALLVSVKGFTTKPNRGRTYIGGGVEGNMVKSLWDISFRTTGENFINTIVQLNNAGTNPLDRVAVQWNSSHTMVTAWNEIPILSAYASEVPATQRRRRIGVGI